MKKNPNIYRLLVLLLTLTWLVGCLSTRTDGSLTTWPKASAAPVETSIPATETPAPLPILPAETNQPTLQSQLEPSATPPPLPTFTPTAETPQPLRFAVIGDYGGGGDEAGDVAALVDSWKPDFVVTVGDNNYPDGAAETIDQNIGQFYQQYIFPYQGAYGPGADQPRFFPTLGNHDWTTNDAQPYLDYFELPGNERYYDFTWGPVHLFAVNSDSREPDGVSSNSIQAQWLQQRLAESTSPWKVVVFHTTPYSSGYHGATDWMRWPFKEWGASIVLAGHDHDYERLIVDGFPYIVNGLGGGAIYSFGGPVEGSQKRYNADYGAMLVTADEVQITFEFYNRLGELIDSFQMSR